MYYKISFPHMGNYHIAIKKLLTVLIGNEGEVMSPPRMTKRTLELGSKNGPDFVCVPFKYNLGNFIESLEQGANLLLQTGGGCRMGYYGEVQEQILRDLGYDFKFQLINAQNANPKDFYNFFKKINPKLGWAKSLAAFALSVKIIGALDKLEQLVRDRIGFEEDKGTLEKLEKSFLLEIDNVCSAWQVNKIYKNFADKIKAVPINKPQKTIKVGVVGELYLLMEPFSNYFIEIELAKYGIEVKRFINLSYMFFSSAHSAKKMLKQADGYLKYEIGADGTDSVAKTVELAKQGFDGVLHLKPFGCIPEINSMPILQRVSQHYKIPVLYFSFDSQTCETGVKTRLEAFRDMLEMKNKAVIV